MKDTLPYCGQIVRDYDPDRYVLSAFMPERQRSALWALYAFNHEIAKTREVVSETALGQMRLKWWVDAIEEYYKAGEVLDHEVLKPLVRAIQDYDLPFEPFETMIYAREFDLEDVLPSNIEGLLNYIDFTSAPLLELSARIAGADIDMEPIRPIAINYGLVGLIRAIPYHGTQGRCYLPEDFMAERGLKKSEIHTKGNIEALCDAIERLVDHFVFDICPDHPHLKRVQKLATLYCKKIRACGYNPYHRKMAVPLYFKGLRLLFSG